MSRNLRLALLLIGSTFAAYFPAFAAGFVWNDADYVTKPGLRSLAGLWRIWSEVGATEQYYPLLHSSFWLQHRLWGDAPAGYHLVNVSLHALSAVAFALVLRRLAVPGAWLATFLFALHPVCVESVAWIAEQKNTLSTLFYLLAALAYLRFAERRDRRDYVLASLLFLAALLSKSVTATLPAALLVIAWWRHGRIAGRADVIPLLPWFVVGAAAGLFTGWAERHVYGAEGADFDLTFAQRFLLAGRIPWFYLGKLLWPAELIFIYPRWEIDAHAAWQYLFPAATAALLFACWRWRTRSRAPLAAVLFFGGTLFPTLGFFNVYGMIYSYVADHWQYLPSLGIFAVVAAGVVRATSLLPTRFDTLTRPAFVALIGGLALLTWRQTHIYADMETFYRTTLARNPSCWLAWNNLGLMHEDAGRRAEAAQCYRRALDHKPTIAAANYNLALLLRADGQLADAITHYERALAARPKMLDAHVNLGNCLDAAGRRDDAIARFRRALELSPRHAAAHYNLARVLQSAGHTTAALEHYGEAVAAQPDFAPALLGSGLLLRGVGRADEAARHVRRALALDPALAEAHFALALIAEDRNRPAEAAGHLRTAVRLKPGYAAAHEKLGIQAGEAGRTDEALAHFRAALRADNHLASAHYNLALLLSALGNHREAADHAARAREIDPTLPPVAP